MADAATIERRNERTHTVSEWIGWAGGPRPVDKRTLVQVQMRFEETFGPDENQMPRRAEGYNTWEHIDEPHLDIIAYRVVQG